MDAKRATLRDVAAAAGPQSLLILEKALGEPPRDIGFNRSRSSSMGGAPVRVLRTGISGELGYELHGAADDADRVWRAVAAAGQESGLHQPGSDHRLQAAGGRRLRDRRRGRRAQRQRHQLVQQRAAAG